ncbi:ABC transporter substrate-binding protein, partial [Candidatus Bipolaricaulota bacterium]
AGREEHGGPITERDAVIYDFDLEEAAALLDKCGIFDTDGDGIREFEDGTPVEFTLNWNIGSATWTDCAAIHAVDLEKVGIRVILDAINWNSLVTNLFSGTWEAIMIGLAVGEEPHGGVDVFSPGGRLHFWHYSAAEGDTTPYEERIDQLFRLGASTFDLDVVFEYYKEFQILFAAEDLGLIYTDSPGNPFAVYDKFGNAELFTLAGDYEGYGVIELIYELGDGP